MSSAPVYVACLTAPESAAVATVGLCGPRAWSLIDPFFQPRGKRTADPTLPNQFWVGRLGEEVTDDVVVTCDELGDQQRIAIHCHGGTAVVRWLIDLLRQRGAIEIAWDDWLRRTSHSPLQGEAAIALAHARTLRTASILLDQYNGAWDREWQAIDTALANGDTSNARRLLEALTERIPLGRHLTTPWRVVVAGAPNVGKSTLVNALLGYHRAITSPMAGTTRDVLTAVTAFDGWPVELMDTAGLHAAAEDVEAIGIARAEQALGQADLCLWVIDRTQSPPVLPPANLCCPLLLICNKADRATEWQEWSYGGPSWSISALTGQGLAELVAALVQRLVPNPPPPGAAVPFTEEMCRQVTARLQG